MPAIISLDKITTVLSPTSKRHSFMPSNAALDTVKYCLGLKRGGIDKYKNSKLLVTTLQEDMIALLRATRWALLPSREILEKIRDLYADNHAKGTYNLADFTKAIPGKEFDYDFLCLSPPADCHWRVDNVAYLFPLENFPRIRTTIHPCFLFTTLIKFMSRGPPDQSHLKCMEGVVRLCDNINLLRIRPVYISWLGSTITGRDFPNRMTPVAREDPPHLPPPLQPARASKVSRGKQVAIKSPPKPTGKRAGAAAKKMLLKAPPPSKAAVSVKTAARKKVSQSSASSADAKAPAKRRSPRFNKD
ncbi:hypothetical protein CPB85DRAFT_1435710 [Mucidula mucida]|nr:hypothetical protein CPB85DRAFT_1435710 [Mucidula mucida]